MKNELIFILLLLPFYLLAQNETKVWRMVGVEMNFKQDTITFDTIVTPIGMSETNASICDKRGKLLFFTNGISIWGKDNEIVPNGYQVITGSMAQNSAGVGLPLVGAALVLPAPDDTSNYYILHECPQFLITGFLPFELLCEKVFKDVGNGYVTDRMKVVINDTIASGQLTAVHHSNGQDWWVIIPVPKSNLYYKLLITNKGILGPYSQYIGSNHYQADAGTAAFTPDGTKYVRFDMSGALVYIYDFDRCNGELSNHRCFSFGASGGFGGISISPNSRYLYVTQAANVHQFDLLSNNIANSKINIGQYDGFYDDIGNNTHIYTVFSVPQSAPNGKIYISSSNTRYLHIIHSPDSFGLAANLQQHALRLPYQNYTIPNFANYSLGAAATQCDTVFYATAIESPQEMEILSLYPNPAQDEIHLSFSQRLAKNTLFSLRDLQGRVVFTQTLREGGEDFVLEMGNLAKGMYFWEVRVEGKLLQAGKLLCE